MPYSRPSLTELRAQGLQDIVNAGISGIDAFLRFAILPVLTWVQAQMAWLHFDYLDWIALQSNPSTATGENLANWGSLKQVSKKAATSAAGVATFTATAGSSIPAGAAIVRSDNTAYVAGSDSSMTGTTLTVSVIASTAGAAGNAAAGTLMALGSPVPGVQTSGALTKAATGGADIETDDAYRTRVIQAYQAEGSDGRAGEYETWALSVPGVTRAWVVRNGLGTGTVLVQVMFDIAEAASGGFPVGTDGAATAETRWSAATGDQLAVANAIWPDQAVTALVVVASPVAQPTPFVIADLGAGNTPANQAAIQAALDDMFLRLSAPGGTIHPNEWEEALAAISTLPTFNVTSPSTPIVGASIGALPVRGPLTFVS